MSPFEKEMTLGVMLFEGASYIQIDEFLNKNGQDCNVLDTAIHVAFNICSIDIIRLLLSKHKNDKKIFYQTAIEADNTNGLFCLIELNIPCKITDIHTAIILQKGKHVSSLVKLFCQNNLVHKLSTCFDQITTYDLFNTFLVKLLCKNKVPPTTNFLRVCLRKGMSSYILYALTSLERHDKMALEILILEFFQTFISLAPSSFFYHEKFNLINKLPLTFFTPKIVDLLKTSTNTSNHAKYVYDIYKHKCKSSMLGYVWVLKENVKESLNGFLSML
jgi:hypothetical protein